MPPDDFKYIEQQERIGCGMSVSHFKSATNYTMYGFMLKKQVVL